LSIPALNRFIPLARTFDKMTYLPRIDGRLHRIPQADDVNSGITSGETDVCVLATVLEAIDRGYEVKLLSDAVSSGVDETHDTTLGLLGCRFSVQVDVLTTDEFRTSR
jgi:nicotinamidase-related amidase